MVPQKGLIDHKNTMNCPSFRGSIDLQRRRPGRPTVARHGWPPAASAMDVVAMPMPGAIGPAVVEAMACFVGLERTERKRPLPRFRQIGRSKAQSVSTAGTGLSPFTLAHSVQLATVGHRSVPLGKADRPGGAGQASAMMACRRPDPSPASASKKWSAEHVFTIWCWSSSA